MSLRTYTVIQKVLHGVSAVLIVWLLISGFYVALVDVTAPSKQFVNELNISLSLLLTGVIVPRLFISFGRGIQAVVDSRQWMPWLAFIIHTLIYLTVITVLVTGVLMMSGPISFFNVIDFPHPLTSPVWIARFALLHTQACAVLALLVTVHIGAVIKHQLSGRATLQRMFT